MTCYMPYKLRSASSFAAYKKEADKFLNKVGDTGVKVLLEIPAAAPDYVLLDDTDPWTGIENLSALAKLKNAKPSSFWHVMQAWQREDYYEDNPPEAGEIF